VPEIYSMPSASACRIRCKYEGIRLIAGAAGILIFAIDAVYIKKKIEKSRNNARNA
jgi:hypothetical protein